MAARARLVSLLTLVQSGTAYGALDRGRDGFMNACCMPTPAQRRLARGNSGWLINACGADRTTLAAGL